MTTGSPAGSETMGSEGSRVGSDDGGLVPLLVALVVVLGLWCHIVKTDLTAPVPFEMQGPPTAGQRRPPMPPGPPLPAVAPGPVGPSAPAVPAGPPALPPDGPVRP